MHKEHIINSNYTIERCLNKLNNLGLDKILFLTNNKSELIGSLTDGDIRRGLLSGLTINDPLEKFIKKNPKHIKQSQYSVETIASLNKEGFQMIPILNDKRKIVDIINFRTQSNYLPVDAILMAGGLGSRLKPLTDKTPKPLLKVGNKPAIQHNVDRLLQFGINNYYFCLNHMKQKIQDHLNAIYDTSNFRPLNLQYVFENFPMGTIGSVSQINNFKNEYILVTNADVITKIDYEKFFLDFQSRDADLSMITIPYSIDIPYGVTSIETSDNSIVSLEEKPKYTHYCNAGIYLLKKSILSQIPKNKSYNATDLVKKLIKKNYKVISYPTHDYWMDIGSIEDYKQANEDVKNLGLS